jgi:hypothetical protein
MPHARAQRWWSAKIIWVHLKQIQKENHIPEKKRKPYHITPIEAVATSHKKNQRARQDSKV